LAWKLICVSVAVSDFGVEELMGQNLKLGIAGLGTIGGTVLRHFAKGGLDFELCGICTRSHNKAKVLMTELGVDVPLLTPEELAQKADVIAEAVTSSAFVEVIAPAVDAGVTIVTVSGGALLQHPEIVERARKSGARIILATGALLGLDAVRAAALGNISSVHMVTRKPPQSLKTAAYVVEHNISLDNLNAAKQLYQGPAREGCALFPANVNVAAALSLAGIGADETHLEIWADPAVDRNTHTISVESDSARLTMTIENIPTSTNPATGRITAQSVLAALDGLVSPLRVGS
jgi:aspartate dehydrogenase